MFNADENTPDAGSGGQYLEAGFHGPAYITFSYEDFSPQGTSGYMGLAVNIEDENGATARVMMGAPDPDNERAVSAVQGRFKQLAKSYVNQVNLKGGDFEEFCNSLIKAVGNTSKTPVWVKLQYRNGNYTELGRGTFIEPYKQGVETTLTVQGDRMEKKEVPEAPQESTASGSADDDVL